MIFQKESTRTRVSFNVGFKKMGGNCIELNAKFNWVWKKGKS